MDGVSTAGGHSPGRRVREAAEEHTEIVSRRRSDERRTGYEGFDEFMGQPFFDEEKTR